MAMSHSICAMPRLRTSAHYAPKWIEAVPGSDSVPPSSWDFFGRQDSV
jgi:hypothetical protein